jgi:UDP-glucose 4-epimerase
MKNVLVTGASGFIGSYLVKELRRQDYTVRTLSRQKNTDAIYGDLTQPDSLEHCCDNIDIVFHLGGYAHAWEENDPGLAVKHNAINFIGTQNIFTIAARAGVKRFIYFSSVKAVADSNNCIDESWTALPPSPYGKAKRDAENFLLATAPATHTEVCILRPALVYGSGWKGNLAAMLRAIDKGFFLPVPTIANRRSMVSLADLSTAAILCATHPNAAQRIFFVTDSVGYSTRRLYTAICAALDKPIPKWHVPFAIFKLLGWLGDAGQKIFRRRLPFSSQSLEKLFGSAEYNATRIHTELGFTPQFTLENFLPEIITAYQTEETRARGKHC